MDNAENLSLKFKAGEQADFKLKNFSTFFQLLYENENDYKLKLAESIKKLSKLQELLYASNSYSVLIIFQGMDSAGKDSIIKHVMSGINPQGCQVHSFKHPSLNELEHDFLWRANMFLPERGNIGIFNRSYYEDVLIVRVHPEILKSENLIENSENQKDIWEQRFESINDLEKHLYRNGTKIIKFFLHLSKEEQRERFLQRIEEPDKNWKFSESDIAERKFWDEYQNAYEQCLKNTSTNHASWYVVPADDKKNARLVISNIIVNEFKNLNLKYPEISKYKKDELEKCKKMLVSEK